MSDTLIDDLVEGVQMTASSPTTPQPTVVAKMAKLKIERLQTLKKFLAHFKQVPKIVKSISDIKFSNTQNVEETKKNVEYMSNKKQSFATRVDAAVKLASESSQLLTQEEKDRELKKNQINLPISIEPETTSADTPHLR